MHFRGLILELSIEKARAQIAELTASGINVSVGDSKVALMGRLLCELSRIGSIEEELVLLSNIEKEANVFLADLIIKPKQKVEYEFPSEPIQLTLFEPMRKYLSNNRINAD